MATSLQRELVKSSFGFVENTVSHYGGPDNPITALWGSHKTAGLALPSAESHYCVDVASISSPEVNTEQGEKVLFCPYLRQLILFSSGFFYYFPPILAVAECQVPSPQLKSGQVGQAWREQHFPQELLVSPPPGASRAHTYLSLNPRTTFWMRMTLSVMALSLSISSSMSW